jgi:hypothetical protein
MVDRCIFTLFEESPPIVLNFSDPDGDLLIIDGNNKIHRIDEKLNSFSSTNSITGLPGGANLAITYIGTFVIGSVMYIGDTNDIDFHGIDPSGAYVDTITFAGTAGQQLRPLDTKDHVLWLALDGADYKLGILTKATKTSVLLPFNPNFLASSQDQWVSLVYLHGGRNLLGIGSNSPYSEGFKTITIGGSEVVIDGAWNAAASGSYSRNAKSMDSTELWWQLYSGQVKANLQNADLSIAPTSPPCGNINAWGVSGQESVTQGFWVWKNNVYMRAYFGSGTPDGLVRAVPASGNWLTDNEALGSRIAIPGGWPQPTFAMAKIY